MSAMQLEHGDWELRLGDCLDPVTGLASLPDGCADHVITDPPYEAEAHTQQRRVIRGSVTNLEPLEFPPIGVAARNDSAAQMSRVSRRWVLVFCQAEAVGAWRDALVSGGATWKRSGIWLKPDAMPQITGDRPGTGYESIAIAHAPGRSRWSGGGRHGVWEQSARWTGGEPHVHPTQKPPLLMEALVRDFTDPGDLVLDPFAGSGTTGVACRRLGRRFLGWERDPKFHAAAVKRIGAAREQLGLLERAKASKVEQGDMFKPGKAVRP